MLMNTVKGRWIAGAIVVAGPALAGMPALAACAPSAPSAQYWYVPVSLSTTNTAGVVSYASGMLNASSGAWSGGTTQVFSDRNNGCPSGQLCTPRPFGGSEDNLGVKVKGTASGAITVTMTLESWGNGQFSFTGYCDKTTNLLYGSASWSPNVNSTMVVIQFGAPFHNAPPQLRSGGVRR
jgi:hypothetical protein